MSAYSREQERAIRVMRLITDWTKSGLLLPEQRDRIAPELETDLRRTNLFLRATLFVFGLIIGFAVAGLMAIGFDLREQSIWVFATVIGLLSCAGAVYLVNTYRLYRFGVEEAFTVASVTLLGLAAVTFFDFVQEGYGDRSVSMGFAAAAVAALVAFWYFGYVYAAIGSMLLAASVPLELVDSDATRRLLAVAIFAAGFLMARRRRAQYGADYPGDSFAIIEAAAWAGIYLMTNLKISAWITHPEGPSTFYWVTYGAIWILPAIGLWLAIRDRHRWMLDVNAVIAIATLMSNKAYLGGEQRAWDPIAFGVLLIVVAVALRRWLASGDGGFRGGFTAQRLLDSDKQRLAVAGTATVLAPGAPSAHTETDPGIGGGGRSGGAGASGTF